MKLIDIWILNCKPIDLQVFTCYGDNGFGGSGMAEISVNVTLTVTCRWQQRRAATRARAKFLEAASRCKSSLPPLALAALVATLACPCKPAMCVGGSLADSEALFLTSCILVPCVHGLVLAAGILPPRLPFDLCTNASCIRCSTPWWEQPFWALTCPHGICSPNFCVDGMCLYDDCVLCASEHLEAARLSIPELPGMHDPVRWPREWRSTSLDAQDT